MIRMMAIPKLIKSIIMQENAEDGDFVLKNGVRISTYTKPRKFAREFIRPQLIPSPIPR